MNGKPLKKINDYGSNLAINEISSNENLGDGQGFERERIGVTMRPMMEQNKIMVQIPFDLNFEMAARLNFEM